MSDEQSSLSDFDALVELLRAHGYKVETDRHECYDFAAFDGHNISGAFGGHCYPSSYLDNRLAADNAGCFNKISQCPLIVELPKDDVERGMLLGYFRFLGSNLGYDWSASFGFRDNPILPCNPLVHQQSKGEVP
jgi:hypothetical protein